MLWDSILQHVFISMDRLPAKPQQDPDILLFHHGNELRDTSCVQTALKICRSSCRYELSIMLKYEGHSCKAVGARSTYLIVQMVKQILPTPSAAACALERIVRIIGSNVRLKCD